MDILKSGLWTVQLKVPKPISCWVFASAFARFGVLDNPIQMGLVVN